MTNVEALKKLAAAKKGGNTTPSDIPGDTIAQVISYIADIIAGSTGGTLTALTVTSTAGTEEGKTAVSVSPALTSGNSYAYKTSAATIDEPVYGETITGATTWNGTDEITATNGNNIVVYEINTNGKCVGYGTATVHTLAA